MVDIRLRKEKGSLSAPLETEPSVQEHETRLYLWPNRSTIRAQEMRLVFHSQTSSDVETTEDFGHEGYHNRIVASEIEPDRFQETQLLTSQEVKQRAYEALRRAEQRRKEIREQEAAYMLVEADE
ncbi:MAG: hypothetical protein KKD28_06405 [Chloroflexi bacterium]|nr:hypothetical protein [Chloroflexota bacterium]